MEGDTLYSVKWYRNEQEFFRYVPNDRPKLQIFPQEGIRVEVKPEANLDIQHLILNLLCIMFASEQLEVEAPINALFIHIKSVLHNVL